jgi:glutathionylspermidine synthase
MENNQPAVGQWAIEPGQKRVHLIASFKDNNYNPTEWSVARAACGTRAMWLRQDNYHTTTDASRFCPKCKKLPA